MSQGTQNSIVATDLPSFPWVHGDKLFAVPVNNEFIALQNQISNLANQIAVLQHTTNETNLGVSITTSWGGSELINAGTYIVTGSSPYDFTITSVTATIGTNGGSFIATVTDDGAALADLTNIPVNSNVPISFPAHDIVTQGSVIAVIISNIIGVPLNAWVTINGTTNAVPSPTIGVTVGQARGTSTAVASGLAIDLSHAFFFATGAATVVGHAMTAVIGTAQAAGIATGTAAGVALQIGNRVANAAGTSTANAVGSFTVGFPTFVMDDPITGVLDQNPLG